uniref:CSD domain-containing protein n=1 Tax=Alexandrium andersonii TaxID=327968 RepID=A0A7S2I904_9DINO
MQDFGGYDPGYGQLNFSQRGQSMGNMGASGGVEHGTVSAWHDDKGFGFILCDATQESLYVHRTGLAGGAEALREGDKVEFGRTQDSRDVERGKFRAANVRILSGGGGGRDRSRSPRRR